jgi:nitrate reductase gamma subunit
MKYSRLVLSISLALISFLGLFFMFQGDKAVLILPEQVGNLLAKQQMILGLQDYFYGFALVLLLVGLAFLFADREDEKEEVVTVVAPPQLDKK